MLGFETLTLAPIDRNRGGFLPPLLLNIGEVAVFFFQMLDVYCLLPK
jgi:hypothetical protein